MLCFGLLVAASAAAAVFATAAAAATSVVVDAPAGLEDVIVWNIRFSTFADCVRVGVVSRTSAWWTSLDV